MCSSPGLSRRSVEVGWDEAGWHLVSFRKEAGCHPVSFRKAPKPSLYLLTVAKSSDHIFFSRFETIPLLLKQYETTLGIIIFFCTNSNVKMRRMAIMKELHFTLSV
jgi:hypothetical protein